METWWGHGRLPIPSCHLAWFHDNSAGEHTVVTLQGRIIGNRRLSLQCAGDWSCIGHPSARGEKELASSGVSGHIWFVATVVVDYFAHSKNEMITIIDPISIRIYDTLSIFFFFSFPPPSPFLARPYPLVVHQRQKTPRGKMGVGSF